MTAEEALEFITLALREDGLSQTQRAVFRGVWEEQSYVQIAISLGYEYGYVKDVGAQIWRSLSRVLPKKVTKTNAKAIITNLAINQTSICHSIPPHSPQAFPQASQLRSQLTAQLGPRRSWDDRPSIDQFYGRTEEQALLQRWLVADQCRFVAILGIGGVGKTALATRIVQQVEPAFEYVIWRSLRHAPPLSQVLSEIILFLSDQQDVQPANSTLQQRAGLLRYLRQHRCLLVLDNLESILQSGDPGGEYRSGYEDYGSLIEQIADEKHQSCLLMTSREKPRGMGWREGHGLPVRSLDLSGLGRSASQTILSHSGIDPQRHPTAPLIDRYGGNPLALKIAAATIRSVFDGRVTNFLNYGSLIVGDLWKLLDSQFQRLSDLEKTVMRWLAINRDWTSLQELQADIVPPVSRRLLLEAVESLKARSLIETGAAGLTQQPVVMEYMTERLITGFYREIQQEEFELLKHHAVIKADSKEFIRKTQIRQICHRLLDQLLDSLNQQSRQDAPQNAHQNSPQNSHQIGLEQQLKQLLSTLKQQSAKQVGYAGGNLVNLLCQLNADLRQQDFSSLVLWQAHLSGRSLQGMNLNQTDLRRSVFSEAVGSAIALAFSSDGQLLAAGDTNGEIHLWAIASGQKQCSWKAHRGWIWSVAFSPDGQQLASGSEDQAVKLWDVNTGELCMTLEGHQSRVASVAWSFHPETDAAELFSGSEDGTVKHWDLSAQNCLPNCLKTLSHPGETIEPIAVSSNFLASSGSASDSIYLWDTKRGTLRHCLKGHQNGVRALAICPVNQQLISGGLDATVRIWDLQTGDCLKVLTGHLGSLWSVSISDDGSLIASAGEDQTVKIWDTETGVCLRTLQGFSSRVWSIAFQPQSLVLAACDDQSIKLWSVESGYCLKTFRGYPQVNWSVAFTSDSNHLVCGGQEQIVRLWDVETETCEAILEEHSSYVHALCHHPIEPILASAAGDRIYLWHLKTQQLLRVLEGHTGQIWQVMFSPEGESLISSSFDHTAKIWNWKTGVCQTTLQGHQSWAFGIAISPDGQQIATSSIDQTIKLWQAQTGDCLKTFATETDWMSELVFCRDGQMLLSGSSHGRLMAWHLEADQPFRILEAHRSHISGICFSPDGRTFVSSSHDRTLKLWSMDRFDCLRTLTGHENMVSSAVFRADGRAIASASHDETIRLWDAATGECLKVLRAPRPYEGMQIQGVLGLTEAQKADLRILGAV